MPRLTRDEAVEAVIVQGRSAAEVSRAAGVRPDTVRRWVRRELAALEEEGPVPEEDPVPDHTLPPEEPTPEELTEDSQSSSAQVLRDARAVYREAMELAREARQQGNTQGAQRAYRDAMNTLPVIARLEKMRGEDHDAITFSRREIDQAMASVYERVAVVAQRPMLCARCSRQLAIELAREGLDDE